MIETILIVFVMIAVPAGIVLGLVLSHYWKKQSKSVGFSINLHSLVLYGAERLSPRFSSFLYKHHTVLQYFEYALIGALGTGVNALIYFPLANHVGNELSWLLGIVGAFTFNFFLNKYLVFKE